MKIGYKSGVRRVLDFRMGQGDVIEMQPEVTEFNDSGIVRDPHYYRTRMECAKRELKWRGLKMPAKPTKEKPVTPRKVVQRPPAVVQPDLFADMSPPPLLGTNGWSVIARLQAAKAQRQQAQ